MLLFNLFIFILVGIGLYTSLFITFRTYNAVFNGGVVALCLPGFIKILTNLIMQISTKIQLQGHT